MHELYMSFHITQAILIRHLMGVNYIPYMYPALLSQVSDLFIYPDVMVSNTIRKIRQALTAFSKPDT